MFELFGQILAFGFAYWAIGFVLFELWAFDRFCLISEQVEVNYAFEGRRFKSSFNFWMAFIWIFTAPLLLIVGKNRID